MKQTKTAREIIEDLKSDCKQLPNGLDSPCYIWTNKKKYDVVAHNGTMGIKINSVQIMVKNDGCNFIMIF